MQKGVSSMESMTKEQQFNLKLFPYYKMVSWDLLFYYAINFLFLTTIKGLSASEVLFTDAFYPIFKLVLQFVLVGLIDKLKFRKSILLANIVNAFSILVLILGDGIPCVIFSWFLMAFGYTIKDICDANLLYSFIPKSEKRNNIFSQVDGKGSSLYYYLDAISSLATGFLFVIHGYLPMIICFSFCTIGAILAYQFKPVEDNNIESSNLSSESQSLKTFFRNIKHSFLFIFHSNRLKGLLLCSALFYTLLNMLSTLNSSLLVDLHFPEKYYGVLFGLLEMVAAFSAKKQSTYHKKLRNRTLTYFAMFLSIPLIFLGLFINIGLPYEILLICTFLVFAIRSIIKGPYFTLIHRYLSSFSTPKLGTRIYSADIICSSLCRSLFSLFASWLLSFTTTSYVFIIIGCIFTLLFIFLLDYMKTRVGLKPEEYKKSDIEFVELK